MTAIVGVLCKDGVVIGSDSATTFAAGGQQRTIEQPSKKIKIINNSAIISGTGSVGLGQRFCTIADDYFKTNPKKRPIDITVDISRLVLQNFQHTGLTQYGYGALLAFHHSNDFHLCEFEYSNMQPEFKTKDLWYVSMGSGQTIADPFLGFVRKVFWDNQQPSLKDGIFGTIWALQHTIDMNTGGVNGPIQLSTITKNGDKIETKILDETEIVEHVEYVREFENHLKGFKGQLTSNPTDLPKLD
jgi:20S proteasome alpha/beta subunit